MKIKSLPWEIGTGYVKNWKMPRWWKNCDLFDPHKRWRSPTTLWFAGQAKQIPERWPIPMGVIGEILVFKHLKKPPAMENQANMIFFIEIQLQTSEFHLFLLAENMRSTRNNRLNQPSGLTIPWFLPKNLVFFHQKLILQISLSIRKRKTHFALGKILYSTCFFNPWNHVLIMRLQRNLRW